MMEMVYMIMMTQLFTFAKIHIYLNTLYVNCVSIDNKIYKLTYAYTNSKQL